MILRPCLRCPKRKDCDKRDEKREKLKGSGITTCSFPCKDRIAHVPIGQRVRVELTEVTDESYSYMSGTVTETGEVEHEGTVFGYKTLKVKVWLDEPTDRGNIRISMWPDLVEPIEGTVEVCPECGTPADRENDEKWSCWKCAGHESQEAWVGVALPW